jgi:hypothetical protein
VDEEDDEVSPPAEPNEACVAALEFEEVELTRLRILWLQKTMSAGSAEPPEALSEEACGSY